jgi:long-chain acyl-CoA synthetase
MPAAHHATSLNLATILDQQARLTPDWIAVSCGGVKFTYAQLQALSSQVAGGLQGIGIRPGDHVALSCPNIPWFPVAYYGILKAGAVVVPLNVLLKPREIAYHLKDSEARALIVFEGTPELPMATMAQAACSEVGCEHLIVATREAAGTTAIPGATTLGALMAGRSPQFATRSHRPDDTAVILYTSGTTGHPKGAELTHLNMLLNAMASRDMFVPAMSGGLNQDVALITLPLFHSTAQTCQMNSGVLAGMKMVLLPRFEPAAVLETMRSEQVGFWIGVPTMYWTLLQFAGANSFDTSTVAKHLRLCVSGGAPMPGDVMRRFESTFGVRILEGYGLSETSPVAAFNQLHRPTKPGTVGQPVLGVEIRCIDAQGQAVSPGEPGEIVIRGPNVMKGYYNRPEATTETMRGGWFHTGDVGTLDEDGYLTIVDRTKDMIIRGGFNVYPREIEEVLMTHPAVALAAVIGVPDERLGEEVKAYVVRRPGVPMTEDELIEWSREQFAAYKYPRLVEFRDALPISATGKILKRELRTAP